MHYTDQTHFFRDAQDNRTVVVTTQTGPRAFEALIICGLTPGAGENAELNLRGVGWSRHNAIADLNEKIQQARADV